MDDMFYDVRNIMFKRGFSHAAETLHTRWIFYTQREKNLISIYWKA